jgi:hypothetical protein
MILIAHRGNLKGPDPERENNPEYIDEAIEAGYDVEVDIWYVGEEFFLGHDKPQYRINYKWLLDRRLNLWVHCKNLLALSKLINSDIHCFWHQEDDVTLTNEGVIWAYPGKQPIRHSIAVMPEINDDDLSDCMGICSDYVVNYI